MRNLAVITARGGSKRIPRKNIKDFCGKPILSYSIEAAIDAGIFDTVMVSTDDYEIAELAKKLGAEVPFIRSKRTSDDFSTTNDVLHEVFNEYEKRGVKFNVGCCIYPTAPFVTPEKLRNGVNMLLNSEADTLIPVVAFSYPPQRAMHEISGRLEFLYPENLDARSQDLEKHYHDAGQFYVFKVEKYKINKKLMIGNIIPMHISELEVQDIDNLTDWKLAELKYQLVSSKGRNL